MSALNLASIGMAVISCLGVWLGGTNPRWGWVYGIASQVAWAIYGALTGQSGLIIMSVVFSVLYVRNLYRWRHTRFEVAPEAQEEPCPVGS